MTHHRRRVRQLFETLITAFGPQGWWPGETPFEIALGAILTQNTAWTNVARVIADLKAEGLLHPRALQELPQAELARRLRPVGYYNLKAARVHNFLAVFARFFDGALHQLDAWDTEVLRRRLLEVKGIGPETADSILLYAFQRPTFVVDAYTFRILGRHALVWDPCSYEELRQFFLDHLPRDLSLFQEFHALLVRLGKDYCRPTPRCQGCPLESWLT